MDLKSFLFFKLTDIVLIKLHKIVKIRRPIYHNIVISRIFTDFTPFLDFKHLENSYLMPLVLPFLAIFESRAIALVYKESEE